MNLEVVFHMGYYDGTLNGVAKLDGELIWFEYVGDPFSGEERVFGLYRISEEDMKTLLVRHEQFQECVGYHTDHHPDVYKPFKMKSRKKFDEFYEYSNTRKSMDLTHTKIGEAKAHEFKYWLRPRS